MGIRNKGQGFKMQSGELKMLDEDGGHRMADGAGTVLHETRVLGMEDEVGLWIEALGFRAETRFTVAVGVWEGGLWVRGQMGIGSCAPCSGAICRRSNRLAGQGLRGFECILRAVHTIHCEQGRRGG